MIGSLGLAILESKRSGSLKDKNFKNRVCRIRNDRKNRYPSEGEAQKDTGKSK
jgi:hypothetical protein